MTAYEKLSLLLELAVLIVLLLEYFYGRPDTVVKNEEKQRKRLRKREFKLEETSFTQGEGK